MKKRLLFFVMLGMLSAFVFAACGKGAGGETEEPKQEDATEETQEETEEETAAKDNKDEEIKDDESDSTNSDLEFSLGYTAKDEDGNDLCLIIYKKDDGADVALIVDGENATFDEYVSEDSKSSDGIEYKSISVGNHKMGYCENDGKAYLFDKDANSYEAKAITAKESNEIYKSWMD